MSNRSLRGIEPAVMAELRRVAREENVVNTLVLRLIDWGLGRQATKAASRRYADLDSLAGTWSADSATVMAQATAPFGHVDAALWK